MPSFLTAYCGSLALLLVMLVWIFLDDELYSAIHILRHNWGFAEPLGTYTGSAYGWDEHGPRILLFLALSSLAILSILAVCYRLVFGDSRGRSLRSMMLTVALIGLWLTLILSREKIDEAVLRWRARKALPGLKIDAELYLAEGPNMNEFLSDSLKKRRNEKVFTSKWSDSPQLQSCVCMGGNWKIEGGGVRFEIWSRGKNAKIEYRPDESKPDSFTLIPQDNRAVPSFNYYVEKYVELEPHWFLAWYSFTPPRSKK